MNQFISRRSDYVDLDLQNNLKSPFCSKNIFLPIVSVVCVTLVIVFSIVFLGPSSTGQNQILTQRARGQDTDANTTTISTEHGRLKGKLLKSRGGREYYAFYNIPYGKPPVGELRFEPPEQYEEGWQGVRDATTPGERCIQRKIGSDEARGSEDCLYLTVYTPKLPPSSTSSSRRRGGRRRNSEDDVLLPVMFYIFGGAFIGGSASVYGGEYFQHHDVIIVLPEYRVGSFGNLNTEDGVISGNMGFKDQTMALKWVQKHISKFGGNKKNVTLFGNSSGGMSIHAHIYSPMSKDLFHGAITQSGSALGCNVVPPNPRKIVEEIGEQLNCTDLEDSKKLVQCLKDADAIDILDAQSSELTGLTVDYVPEDGNLSNVFLPDTPLNLLRDGKIVTDVAWILGANSAEMGPAAKILQNSTAVRYLNDYWGRIAPLLLQFENGSDEVIQKIKEFYFGQNTEIGVENKKEFVDMMSDRCWVHPTFVAATMHSKNSKSPVYLYWLTYESKTDEENGKEKAYDGVSHAAEVRYLFPWSKFPYISLNSSDAGFSQVMVDTWVRFGSRGDVTDGYSFILENGNEWTEVDGKTENVKWLDLHEDPAMVEVIVDRMKFWDAFELDELYG